MVVKFCIWLALSLIIVFSFFAVREDNTDEVQISGWICLPLALIVLLIFTLKGVLI